MSKLMKQYNELKKQDSSSIYLFRVGIFYNILNEDAKWEIRTKNYKPKSRNL